MTLDNSVTLIIVISISVTLFICLIGGGGLYFFKRWKRSKKKEQKNAKSKIEDGPQQFPNLEKDSSSSSSSDDSDESEETVKDATVSPSFDRTSNIFKKNDMQKKLGEGLKKLYDDNLFNIKNFDVENPPDYGGGIVGKRSRKNAVLD